MSPLVVLMGLLVLSYIGSFLAGGRAIRGWGLPSGAEFLALGFVIGPSVLDLVPRSMLGTLEPFVEVALGWTALVIGIDFGFVQKRRVPARVLVGGSALALASAGLVSGAVLLVARGLGERTTPALLVTAAGIGIACSETTRHAVRWVVERHQARGPLADLVARLGDCDDGLPLLATAVLFVALPSRPMPWHLPMLAWAGITVAIGAVLGVIAAILLGREFRLDESWGVLLGTTVLAIGIAVRLELSVLATTFSLGLTLGALSGHRREVSAMVAPTEHPVLLPLLLLAGARLELSSSRRFILILAAALLTRIVAKVLSGLALRKMSVSARNASPALGVGLLSSGALSIGVGLAMALRFPGPIGDTVLAAASLVTVFGEFVAPTALQRELLRAGETGRGPLRRRAEVVAS